MDCLRHALLLMLVIGLFKNAFKNSLVLIGNQKLSGIQVKSGFPILNFQMDSIRKTTRIQPLPNLAEAIG